MTKVNVHLPTEPAPKTMSPSDFESGCCYMGEFGSITRKKYVFFPSHGGVCLSFCLADNSWGFFNDSDRSSKITNVRKIKKLDMDFEFEELP